MYDGADQPSEPRNAFREAEKKYQLHWQQCIRYRKGRRQGGKLQLVPTDVADILNPREHMTNPEGSVFTQGTCTDGRPVFTISSHPGFVLLPRALSNEEQRHLIAAALQQYPEPPANTNHTRLHGKLSKLWEAAQRDLYMEADEWKEKSPEGIETYAAPAQQWVKVGGPSAQQLLRKLRWCTLGPQFDWTARVYDRHQPFTPLPEELSALALRLTASVRDHLPEQSAAEGWEPDVALINYYREGNTLGGHKDDVEQDQTAPIVALSLGCDAIFLLGGQSKDEEPIALRLHSGDAVIMAGPARTCYHGVPRVFGEASTAGASPVEAQPRDDDFAAFTQHMRTTRINISIRAAG